MNNIQPGGIFHAASLFRSSPSVVLFGSGGHSIAYALAERLDLPFYDKEIVLAAAEQSGYSEEYVANQGEHRSSGERLLNRFLLANAPGYKDPQEALFAIQRRIISIFLRSPA